VLRFGAECCDVPCRDSKSSASAIPPPGHRQNNKINTGKWKIEILRRHSGREKLKKRKADPGLRQAVLTPIRKHCDWVRDGGFGCMHGQYN